MTQDELVSLSVKLNESFERWKDTPFVRLQCNLGGGIDCGNLAFVLLQEAGAVMPNIHSPSFDFVIGDDYKGKLNDVLTATSEFVALPKNITVQAGDVLVFQLNRGQQHIGTMIDSEFFAHAWPGTTPRKSNLLQDRWQKKLIQVWRFNEYA
jgi:hypothetical protein